MKDQEISAFYSKFLFQLFSEKKTDEKDLHQLQEVWEIFEKHDLLLKVLDSDACNTNKKQQLIRRIFGDILNATSLILIEKIAKENKLYLLPKIIQSLSYQIRMNMGTVPATVIVSQPLGDRNRSLLQEKLFSTFQKKIEIDEIVDPKIIGGMILLLDHKMLNYSIQTKLLRLKQSLLN